MMGRRAHRGHRAPGKDHQSAAALDEALFQAALEASRREHDLWCRRGERADDQAAALSAIAVTALAALGAALLALFGNSDHARPELGYLVCGAFWSILGAGALLFTAGCGMQVRAPGWSLRKDEDAELAGITGWRKVWSFQGRDPLHWPPGPDLTWLDELAVERWNEGDWRTRLVTEERTEAIRLRGQAEKKQTLVGRAVVTFYMGVLFGFGGVALFALG